MIKFYYEDEINKQLFVGNIVVVPTFDPTDIEKQETE